MTIELKEEAKEQIDKEVQFGFDSKEEILSGILEMFYDEKEIDKNWIRKEIASQFALLQAASKHWKSPTDFDKLAEVFDQLSENGIIAIHKAGYTKQDGYDDVNQVKEQLEKLKIKAKGYCFYHTQDLERAISPEIENLYLAFDSINQKDKEAIEIGKEIVTLLKQKGFPISWEETIDTRILISKIKWQKIPDLQDWSLNRSLLIMTKNLT